MQECPRDPWGSRGQLKRPVPLKTHDSCARDVRPADGQCRVSHRHAMTASLFQVISALHQRFPTLFSVPLVASIQASLQPPSKATLAASSPEQRDKDENARVLRQRGLLRIFAELELLAIVKPDKKSWAVGEATFTILRDLVSLVLPLVPVWLAKAVL